MGFLSSLFGGGSDKVAEAQAAANKKMDKLYKQQKEEAERLQAEMERRELERQNNIKAGNTAIDSAFAQFNPDYYKGAQEAYTSYYTPQIDQQRGDALDKLTAQLFNRGMLESTVGANKIGKVNQTADEAKVKVGNEAVDFGNSLRGKVDAAKFNLYDVSRSAADPSMVGARATGEAASLAKTGSIAPTQPLGDIFGSILAPLGYATQAYMNSPQRRSSYNFAPTSGSGSGKVLN